MALDDTPAEAAAVQRAVFARMTPGQRALVAMAMADEVKEVTKVGIRMRNPSYDEASVHRQWFAILHGHQLADQLLGEAPGPIR